MPLAGLPGLEPGISGPESDVLPLHHRTIKCVVEHVVEHVVYSRIELLFQE